MRRHKTLLMQNDPEKKSGVLIPDLPCGSGNPSRLLARYRQDKVRAAAEKG